MVRLRRIKPAVLWAVNTMLAVLLILCSPMQASAMWVWWRGLRRWRQFPIVSVSVSITISAAISVSFVLISTLVILVLYHHLATQLHGLRFPALAASPAPAAPSSSNQSRDQGRRESTGRIQRRSG